MPERVKRIIYPILFLVLSGCEYEHLELPEENKEQPDTVSYSLDIKPIMTTYCLGTAPQRCHVSNTNQGSPGDFSTYPGLKAKVDNGMIASRVFNPNGGMPPSYSLGPKPVSDEDKQTLMQWIDEGAKEN
jgi:hypothetical protein